MEDCIEESESLVSHLNHDPKEVDGKEKVEDGNEGSKVKEEKKEEEGELGGGIINQLISNMLKPKGDADEGGGKAGLEDEVSGVEEVKEGKKEEELESGGGVINQFISNLLNPKGEENEKEGKLELNDAERVRQVKEEKKEETGGVINQLISNLPASLSSPISENVAPETGEATLLISMIHD